jgi:hypothetical protein
MSETKQVYTDDSEKTDVDFSNAVPFSISASEEEMLKKYNEQKPVRRPNRAQRRQQYKVIRRLQKKARKTEQKNG